MKVTISTAIKRLPFLFLFLFIFPFPQRGHVNNSSSIERKTLESYTFVDSLALSVVDSLLLDYCMAVPPTNRHIWYLSIAKYSFGYEFHFFLSYADDIPKIATGYIEYKNNYTFVLLNDFAKDLLEKDGHRKQFVLVPPDGYPFTYDPPEVNYYYITINNYRPLVIKNTIPSFMEDIQRNKEEASIPSEIR